MLKLCHQSGFAPEAGCELLGGAHVARQYFDGNKTFHGGLVRLIDSRHATFSQWGNNLIGPELFSGKIFQGVYLFYFIVEPAKDILII